MSQVEAAAFSLRFPQDIERLILEEAARSDIKNALRLARVSRLAQSW